MERRGRTVADLTRPQPLEDIEARVRRNMARSLLVARWIMAPIYIGLLAALALVAIKFVQKLVQEAPRILSLDTSETIIAVLTLVDLSLVANLLVIVTFFGWENFVGPMMVERSERQMTRLDFVAVKLKVFGSISAIAAIQLLETFVHVKEVAKTDAMWQLIILLGITVAGVLLAIMDRLGGDEHS